MHRDWLVDGLAAEDQQRRVGLAFDRDGAAFAVEQLGDITLVNIDVKAGDTVTEGKTFGTIESVKTLSDLFAPVSGKVVEVNAALENAPELVNEDAYEKGWMVVIESSAGATDALMDADAYKKHVEESSH